MKIIGNTIEVNQYTICIEVKDYWQDDYNDYYIQYIVFKGTKLVVEIDTNLEDAVNYCLGQ